MTPYTHQPTEPLLAVCMLNQHIQDPLDTEWSSDFSDYSLGMYKTKWYFFLIFLVLFYSVLSILSDWIILLGYLQVLS